MRTIKQRRMIRESENGRINGANIDHQIDRLVGSITSKAQDFFIDMEDNWQEYADAYGRLNTNIGIAQVIRFNSLIDDDLIDFFVEKGFDTIVIEVGFEDDKRLYLRMGDVEIDDDYIEVDYHDTGELRDAISKFIYDTIYSNGFTEYLYFEESKQKRKQMKENRLNKRRIGRRMLKESSKFDITPYIKNIVEEKAKKEGKTVEELEQSHFSLTFKYSISLKPYFKTIKKIKIHFFHYYDDDTKDGRYNIDIMDLDILIWGSKPTKARRVSSGADHNKDFYGFKTLEEMCKYMNEFFVEEDEYFDNLIKSKSINNDKTIKESTMIRRRARRLTEGRRVLPTKRIVIKESAKPVISKSQAEELAQSLVQGVMLDASRTSYDSNLLVKADTSANGVLFESKALYNKENGSFSNVKVLVNGVEKSLLGNYKSSEISELTKNITKHLQSSALLSESKSTCIRSRRMVVESKTLYNDLLKQFKASKTERIHDDYDPEDEEHDIEDYRMEEYEVNLANVKGLKWILGGRVEIVKSSDRYYCHYYNVDGMKDIVQDEFPYVRFEDAVQAVYKELMSIENANKRKKYD